MEWNAYGNAARWPAIQAACREFGVIDTIWFTRPFTAAEVRQAVVESGCAGVAVEGEIPAMNPGEVPNPQAVNWPELIFELHDLPVHKSVVTNFAPFTHNDGTPFPEKSRPLVEAGWKCLTECYDMLGHPSTWIAERAFFAGHLGWHTTQPVLGVYGPPGGGGSLEAFPTRDNYPNWSVWSAEYVL